MNPLNHVAIIMDGNGRWGIKKKKSRVEGHKFGLNTVKKIINSTIENKIKYLTLFAFSTENWKRPKKEIDFLFKLLEKFLIKNLSNFNKNNIKLKILGEKFKNNELQNLLKKAENLTKKNNLLQINLALNYGSRSEILRSIKILNKKKKQISETSISNNLFTKSIPDPEILIRTGNTHRLSNFLLWQISYTEIFFEKKLWPDFNENDYDKIIKKFKNLKRNFGSI